ncbi:MAG: Na(+) H(+) antiporter subunit C [uncultured Thermomicrobiales bacterium]|uniref:Na(+) H(+) antiporter subunit C n=1 Tax=uncultured Thermomicrobiales bacterium TaxID=1645740 RepID=A0A6J4VGA1_9BACT|nr:MAG: Na(+) H(+) antiporter subunit C [uncultured Thermomicrobiales bacterium]
MTLVYSVAVAILFGAGAYMLLKHDLIRVVAGMVLISNAANLFIMSAGLTVGPPPIYPLGDDGPEAVADPLVQAMTLTAIVISFGVSALLLSLVYRVYTSHLSLDLEDLSEAEERDEAAHELQTMVGRR